MPSSHLRGGAAMAMALAVALATPAAAHPTDGEATEEPATVEGNRIAGEVRDAIAANYVPTDKIPALIGALAARWPTVSTRT